MCRGACQREDDEEEALNVALAGVDPEDDVRTLPLSTSCVKMKLNTFLKDKYAGRLRAALNDIVLNANRLVGEAYAFSNFHIVRLLTTPGKAVPVMDRNFFYRCLLSVSVNNARKSTLSDDFRASIQAFDALRPVGGAAKVDICDLNPLVADLSIVMSTMATNHLWMNLNARVSRYVKWRFPKLRKYWGRVASSVTVGRKGNLADMFPEQDQSPIAAEAVQIASELRELLPVQAAGRFASRAHLTLPLYYHIMRETEIEMARRKDANGSDCRRPRLRPFTLLPTKNGFTPSYVPISRMTFVQLVKRLKLETFTGDGRRANHRCIWAKYCDLAHVETSTRKFAYQITTDGYGVSVQMQGFSAPRCSVPDLGARADLPVDALIGGLDPGMKDFATCVYNDGSKVKCSGGEFRDRAGLNNSTIRTDYWNLETKDVTDKLIPAETVTVVGQNAYLRSYLTHLPGLLSHRMKRGYRKMRFMRFCRRKAAISWLCDQIAPKRVSTVVIGFGNWNGGSQSPVSRRSTAPLKDIKSELQSRTNVVLGHVDEYKTSCTCHTCQHRLTNMKADSTIWRRDDNGKKRKVVVHGKIHKVLHCRNSDERSSGRCGTTWDRDVNAAKNILMLTMKLLKGESRPAPFCRVSKTIKLTLDRRSKGKRAVLKPAKVCTLADPPRDTEPV